MKSNLLEIKSCITQHPKIANKGIKSKRPELAPEAQRIRSNSNFPAEKRVVGLTD